MSSSEYTQSEDKEEIFSDSSGDDQEEYEYDDEKNIDGFNTKSIDVNIDLSQNYSTDSNDSSIEQIQKNVIKNLIGKTSTSNNDGVKINVNDQYNDDRNENHIKSVIPSKNSEYHVQEDGNNENHEPTVNLSKFYSNNGDENNIAYSVCSKKNNDISPQPSLHPTIDNSERKGLEPKLPPLHDIKTVGQNSPNSKSARPILQPTSPTTVNNTLRILPPPQRRRSPITRRRQINAPKNNYSFRRNYDILKPDPPTEEENILIKRILRGDTLNFDPTDPNSITIINNLILQLQQLRKQKAKERKYKEGQILNKAIATLERQRSDILLKISQAESKKHLDNDYKEFERRKKEFENKTQQMIVDLQSKQQRQKESMQRDHEEKEQQLFHEWTEGKQVNMYNRSSNELTSLRRQHAFLLVQNRFEEAQKIGNEIEKRQLEELQNNHKEHQKNYDSAYDMLYEKNKEEDEFFENKCSFEMAALIQKRNKERRAFDNKEKWFAQKKNEIADYDKKPSTAASPRNSATNSYATGLNSYRRPIMPSSKMTRNELGGSDVAIFKLPAIVNRRDTRGKSPNKRK